MRQFFPFKRIEKLLLIITLQCDLINLNCQVNMKNFLLIFKKSFLIIEKFGSKQKLLCYLTYCSSIVNKLNILIRCLLMNSNHLKLKNQ